MTTTTEIEMVYDPREDLAGMCIEVCGRHEILPDGEWIRYARRLTGIHDLFVYRHREEGTFVLSKWTWSPAETDRPLALEIHVMARHPDQPGSGRPVGDRLLSLVRPADEVHAEMRRASKDAADARRAQRLERHETRMESARSLRRMGMEMEASALEADPHAWVSPREAQSTAATLEGLAKATN